MVYMYGAVRARPFLPSLNRGDDYFEPQESPTVHFLSPFHVASDRVFQHTYAVLIETRIILLYSRTFARRVPNFPPFISASYPCRF
jgi:hypothetical protein